MWQYCGQGITKESPSDYRSRHNRYDNDRSDNRIRVSSSSGVRKETPEEYRIRRESYKKRKPQPVIELIYDEPEPLPRIKWYINKDGGISTMRTMEPSKPIVIGQRIVYK